MKKISIFIQNEVIYRNFYKSGSFDNLKDYEIFFLSPSSLKLDFDNKKKIYYNKNANIDKYTNKLFSLFLIKFRKSSSSFFYRYLRDFGMIYFSPLKNFQLWPRQLLRFIYYSIVENKFWYFLLPIFSLFFFNFFFKYYKNKVGLPSEIKNHFDKIKIDILILPTTLFDCETIFFEKLCLKYKCKSVILVNNWDNLSSKGIYWFKPNLIGVWSEQARNHALNIHSFNENSIKIIGSPIYDNYFKLRNSSLKNYFSKNYILFTGCNLPFDELNVLKILDKIIITNNIRISIVYRPHPLRFERYSDDNFEAHKFKNIIMDPQVKLHRSNLVNKQLPDLNYYPSLLKNAQFVISPLSTMVVESIIFYKPILLILHNDDYHFTNPKRNMKYFEHLKILKDFKFIFKSNEKKDLENIFLEMLSGKNTISKEVFDNCRNTLLFKSNIEYKENIKIMVDQL